MSFLLGDEYSDSSSDEDPQQSVAAPAAAAASAPATQLLPSADELFASDTSGVLAASGAPRSSVASAAVSYSAQATGKRKSDDGARARNAASAVKHVKVGIGISKSKPKSAPFAPPQLRRPNISTEDRSSWNTDKTLALQRQNKKPQADAASMLQ